MILSVKTQRGRPDNLFPKKEHAVLKFIAVVVLGFSLARFVVIVDGISSGTRVIVFIVFAVIAAGLNLIIGNILSRSFRHHTEGLDFTRLVFSWACIWGILKAVWMMIGAFLST